MIDIITKYKNIFNKGYNENWLREIWTNLWTYKLKYLNGEKMSEVFMKKNCCEVYYKWVTIQNQTVM